MQHLLEPSNERLANWLAEHGFPAYRARQIRHWLFDTRIKSFAEMSDLPQGLRERLAHEFAFANLETVRVLGSNDTTRKSLFRLGDGILIEAVDEAQGLLFDLASSQLNEPLERFLRALGPALAALDLPIEINGHTDGRPFVQGARLSNWDLSYQRAEAARQILEASGVAPRQITGVFARGASQLYMAADPLAPQNRRLSILVKIAKPGDTKLAKTERITPN